MYDQGSCFSPAVLDITDDDIRKKFLDGVRNVASVSLAIGYPTVASVPHSLINGFKNLLAVAAETEITFPEAEKVSKLRHEKTHCTTLYSFCRLGAIFMVTALNE